MGLNSHYLRSLAHQFAVRSKTVVKITDMIWIVVLTIR